MDDLKKTISLVVYGIRIFWCLGGLLVPHYLFVSGDNPLFGSMRPILASDWLISQYSIPHTNDPY